MNSDNQYLHIVYGAFFEALSGHSYSLRDTPDITPNSNCFTVAFTAKPSVERLYKALGDEGLSVYIVAQDETNVYNIYVNLNSSYRVKYEQLKQQNVT